MFTHIARRMLAAVPMLIAISLVSFLMLHLLPGDPAAAALGQRATEENKRKFRERLGLDKSLPEQYGRWVGNAVQGDLGVSFRSSQPVAKEMKQRVPATIELACGAMFLATLIGVSLGILASLRPRSFVDFVCLGFALVGVSMPVFWLGFLMQKALAGGLGLLPFGGRLSSHWDGFEPQSGFYLFDAIYYYNSPELALDVAHHLFLPSLVLATVPMALIARITRSTMLEVLKQDFIRTARAKGATRRSTVLKHALRNALIPIFTSVATQFGYLLGGAVLTETIFSWPGLGRYIIEAIDVGDAQPLQASVLLVASTFILINLLTDISYAFIDPRLRRKGEA